MNGYPGPSHAIELADKLGLSTEQRDKMRALFDAMKAEAIPIGEELIKLEAALDALFANKAVTPSNLATTTEIIGATQAKLRNAHLKYHLTAAVVLSREQLAQYAHLRGYGAGGGDRHKRHH